MLINVTDSIFQESAIIFLAIKICYYLFSD